MQPAGKDKAEQQIDAAADRVGLHQCDRRDQQQGGGHHRGFAAGNLFVPAIQHQGRRKQHEHREHLGGRQATGPVQVQRDEEDRAQVRHAIERDGAGNLMNDGPVDQEIEGRGLLDAEVVIAEQRHVGPGEDHESEQAQVTGLNSIGNLCQHRILGAGGILAKRRSVAAFAEL